MRRWIALLLVATLLLITVAGMTLDPAIVGLEIGVDPLPSIVGEFASAALGAARPDPHAVPAPRGPPSHHLSPEVSTTLQEERWREGDGCRRCSPT
jgi:hypothetical protein